MPADGGGGGGSGGGHAAAPANGGGGGGQRLPSRSAAPSGRAVPSHQPCAIAGAGWAVQCHESPIATLTDRGTAHIPPSCLHLPLPLRAQAAVTTLVQLGHCRPPLSPGSVIDGHHRARIHRLPVRAQQAPHVPQRQPPRLGAACSRVGARGGAWAGPKGLAHCMGRARRGGGGGGQGSAERSAVLRGRQS